ncbi:MAG: hypothetical protein H6812_01120 [Phycisphaeraceae bacterium]|nr:hypothetical protein [Phycisphaeraceae bacterium]
MARGCAIWMAVLGLVLGSLVMGGCALYMNYPPLEGDTSINNPNISPMPEVVEIGLLEVTKRYPVGGAYVVNLPKGTSRDTGEWVREGLGGSARLVGDVDAEGLRVFHVTRVWIRGNKARVEVLAPDVNGAARGVVVEMGTTGIGEWRVSRVRTLASGAVAEPELYGWAASGEAR